jgi:autotransporter strand-loop-strand O-heptosyltransferase
MVKVKVNYKTTLPLLANAPTITIYGKKDYVYKTIFYLKRGDELEKIKEVSSSGFSYIESNITQSFRNWFIVVYENNELIFQDQFNPYNKVIFIKMDGYALGDNIAWIPYVDEFRVKYNCTIICSTFYNDLFKDVYKDILFVEPNTNIENIYAQFYIGALRDLNEKYSDVNIDFNPLQSTAYTTLGLEPKELRPNLEKQFIKYKNKKYVCISEYGSHIDKMWRCENGWQDVVDYLNSIGYDVLVISKEKTDLKNIIDLTGDINLLERGQVLHNADFFIGVSSGLSWLSWGVNTHVFMISDVTHVDHEFKSNITRITSNSDINSIDYNPINITTSETVINYIKNYVDNRN